MVSLTDIHQTTSAARGGNIAIGVNLLNYLPKPRTQTAEKTYYNVSTAR